MVKKIISQNIVIVRVLSHPAKKYVKKKIYFIHTEIYR